MRRTFHPLFALVPVSILTACGSEDPTPAEAPPASQSTAENIRPAGPVIESTYTELDLRSCEQIEAMEEGESSTWRCEGIKGLDFWVDSGDGRFDLDVGTRTPTDFATIGAFNDIEPTLEWRQENGEPFAVIFRYRDVALETPDRTVLAVEKIGLDGQEGCRVAQISGDTPDANRRAREIADTQARGFNCDSSEPRYIGNAR